MELLRAAIWRNDARAWRDIGGRSRATYTTEVYGRGTGPGWLLERVHRLYREDTIQRRWIVRAGEVRQLEAGVLAWRYDRLGLLAAAVLLVAFIAFVASWFASKAPEAPLKAGAADTAAP